MTRRKQTAEKVADYLGWDIADVKEHRYQPKLGYPPVYAFSFGYYTCKPHKISMVDWQPVIGTDLYFSPC